MDISGIFGGLNGFGGTAAKWGVAIVCGGYALSKLNNALKDLARSVSQPLTVAISTTKDPDVQQMLIHAVRFVANHMPEASGDAKMTAAIDMIIERLPIPNWLISKTEIRKSLEIAYQGLKSDLQNIKVEVKTND